MALGLARFRRSPTFVAIICAFSFFTESLLYGIVLPVFPFAISQRAGIALDQVQTWISMLFGIFSAAFLAGCALIGWIINKRPSKRLPFAGSACLLILATLFFCFGKHISLLIIGRALEGLAAAFTWTTALSVLSDAVPHGRTGRWLGYCLVAQNIGMLVAPILGGILFDHCGYYAVFGVVIALLILDLILRLAAIGESARTCPTPTTYWYVEQNKEGSPVLVASEAMTSLWKDSIQELSERLLKDDPANCRARPLKTVKDWLILLRSSRLQVTLLGCCIQSTVLCAFDAVLPQFVNSRFGWTSVGAGLIYLPIVLPYFFAPMAGWLSDRYGPKWPATVGFISAFPFLILLRLVHGSSAAMVALLCSLLIMISSSLVFVMVSLMGEMPRVAKTGDLDDASSGAFALYTAATGVGSLLGSLMGGFVMVRHGWSVLSTVLGLICVTGAPLMACYIE